MGQAERDGPAVLMALTALGSGGTSCCRRADLVLHDVGCDRQVLTGGGSPRRGGLGDWGIRGGFMEEVTVELGLEG